MSNDNFVITTDNTTDFPIGYAEENKIDTIALPYYLNGESDFGKSMNAEESKIFYDKMRSGLMPTTSQPSPTELKEFFEKHLKQGKDILHITLSSNLSGTNSNSRIVAEALLKEYPDKKILVADSLLASMGEGLIVYNAIQMRDTGSSIDEIKSWIDNHVQQYCAYFTVDDLNHLHRGGRVSKFAAVFGSMLSIKPCLHMNEIGKLIPIDKVRGRKQSLDWLVEKYKERAVDMDVKNDIVFLSHADCIEDAEYVKNQIKKKYKVKNFMIGSIGPIIGSHAGPGTVALFFKSKNRTEK